MQVFYKKKKKKIVSIINNLYCHSALEILDDRNQNTSSLLNVKARCDKCTQSPHLKGVFQLKWYMISLLVEEKAEKL